MEAIDFSPIVSKAQTNELFSSLREHYEYIRKNSKNLENFSKSERKVAEVIMASPQTAIHSSIATLAKMADVSEPTVNRFCRRLDTKGFRTLNCI